MFKCIDTFSYMLYGVCEYLVYTVGTLCVLWYIVALKK